WERAQQNRVDHAEERGVGANAERQRDQSDDGQARIAHEHAEPETSVLPKSRHEGYSSAPMATPSARSPGPARIATRTAARTAPRKRTHRRARSWPDFDTFV